MQSAERGEIADPARMVSMRHTIQGPPPSLRGQHAARAESLGVMERGPRQVGYLRLTETQGAVHVPHWRCSHQVHVEREGLGGAGAYRSVAHFGQIGRGTSTVEGEMPTPQRLFASDVEV